jgi:hypothetical protein
MAQALDVGESAFRYVSELTAEGFAPFGTGGAARDLFGMTDGSAIYLCFLLDAPEDQSTRQATLVAELGDGAADRMLPNIPVVCVLTQ